MKLNISAFPRLLYLKQAVSCLVRMDFIYLVFFYNLPILIDGKNSISFVPDPFTNDKILELLKLLKAYADE